MAVKEKRGQHAAECFFYRFFFCKRPTPIFTAFAKTSVMGTAIFLFHFCCWEGQGEVFYVVNEELMTGHMLLYPPVSTRRRSNTHLWELCNIRVGAASSFHSRELRIRASLGSGRNFSSILQKEIPPPPRFYFFSSLHPLLFYALRLPNPLSLSVKGMIPMTRETFTCFTFS